MPEIRKKNGNPVYKTGFLLYIVFQGVETFNPQRQSAPVRQAVFLCLKFEITFSPLKSDFKKINVGRAENTIPERGIIPAYLWKAFEPPDALFRVNIENKTTGATYVNSKPTFHVQF
jgi:hypothetical protein|nr:MAG TPA: hypothetical protein [Caudoviricetes sp.]